MTLPAVEVCCPVLEEAAVARVEVLHLREEAVVLDSAVLLGDHLPCPLLLVEYPGNTHKGSQVGA